MSSSVNQIRQLREILEKSFSLSELRTLCFDLSVDYDDLPGDTKSDKTRGLVEYLVRRDRVNELILAIQKLRPSTVLNDLPIQTQSVSVEQETKYDRSNSSKAGGTSMKDLTKTAAIVGIIGTLVAVFALFRDIFDFKLTTQPPATSIVNIISAVSFTEVPIKTNVPTELISTTQDPNNPSTESLTPSTSASPNTLAETSIPSTLPSTAAISTNIPATSSQIISYPYTITVGKSVPSLNTPNSNLVLDSIEFIDGSRMRWYFTFFNNHTENTDIYFDLQKSYIADGEGNRYAIRDTVVSSGFRGGVYWRSEP
jgi:hypothetical protein